jgi:hypothetical protein
MSDQTSHPPQAAPLTPPPASSSVPPVSEEVRIEVACRRCAYNLRGLMSDGRCPECGTPVGLSLQGDLLRYADPAWLETLAGGLSLMLYGMLTVIAGGVAGNLLAGFTHPVAEHLLTLAGELVGVWGAVLFTRPDPSGLGEERYTNARRVIRICLAVGLVGSAMEAAATLVTAPLVTVLAVLAGIAETIDVAGAIAMLTYIAQIAQRIPAPQHVRRARALRWWLGGSLILLVVCGVTMAIMAGKAGAAPAGARGAAAGVACFAGAAGICVVLFAIMFIVLQFKMLRALREQRQIALATWARASSRAGGR